MGIVTLPRESVVAAVAEIEAAAGYAHPANDGAHRLGWWIAEDSMPVVRAVRIAAAIETGTAFVERLLLGGVVPEAFEATAIAEVTKGAVQPGDWWRGGPLRWCEQPLPRPEGH
ncbi:hypothetical protein [Sphingomonas hengshuiensis]|uniref:Uncharacterized protein n=1 Tax=Sphingomonas hengshuiensis TaxID=1609977 RepID=A0A7U4LFA6_9SPHN|nr:hypothetical protein [Sphingomonas hengshuiensis]AJP72282.1 hypothetical protein TS85_11525 [Sphingomonas hengshuiensis]